MKIEEVRKKKEGSSCEKPSCILLNKVKQKREFSGLPDSIVERALDLNDNDVKEARGFLRKYFGVFLTNKVLKGKGVGVLKSHRSSADRDYEKFYSEIFGVSVSRDDLAEKRIFESVVDLGCGGNCFSYEFLPRGIRYVGVEASGQIVDNANSFFEENGYDASAVKLDLFDLDSVLKIVSGVESPKVVFLFQVVDALESFERNYSKKLLSGLFGILNREDLVVVSYKTEGISGSSGFYAKRKWLVEFLSENFVVESDFEMNGEMILKIRKK